MSNGKIAVVGDRDSVMLFNGLGIEAVYAYTQAETERAIHRLAKEGATIIYVTEPCAELASEAIARYLTDPGVSILPIPNREGSTGLGLRTIKSNVEKAIGADILFDDDKEE